MVHKKSPIAINLVEDICTITGESLDLFNPLTTKHFAIFRNDELDVSIW